MGWDRCQNARVVLQPLLETKYLQTQLISLRTWLQQMCNTPSVPLQVWILGSWFNSSCLRIPIDSFSPKSNFAAGVKEIRHQWIRVFKLCLEQPTPESSEECLVTVLWYPQTDKPHTHMFSAAFKIFQKFLIKAFKNLWKLGNILLSEQIIQCNESIVFSYLEDLLCCSESNSFHPLGIMWCQEWSLYAGAAFMSIRICLQIYYFLNKLEAINTELIYPDLAGEIHLISCISSPSHPSCPDLLAPIAWD